MGHNSCHHCKNDNCLFKFSHYHNVKVEQINIQSGLNVYLENMPVKGLYIVQYGHINEHYINKVGQNEICSTSKNGEIFAHKDLSAKKHLYNAIAVEDSTICFIDKNSLLGVCKNNPELPLKLMFLFSNKLNKKHTSLNVKNG